MSFRSMTTFATSRVNSTRPPFAEMLICSAALEPLNSIVSKPSWPSRVSLSSPGFQTKVSSPAPIRAVSLPSPPLMRSSPSLPMRRSLPRPPFIVSWMPSASRLDGVDHVVAALPVQDEPVVGLLGKEDVDARPGGRTRRCRRRRRPRRTRRRRCVRVDGDRVGRAVAAAVRAAQIDVDPRRRPCR